MNVQTLAELAKKGTIALFISGGAAFALWWAANLV
jgi:hypothetical protein